MDLGGRVAGVGFVGVEEGFEGGEVEGKAIVVGEALEEVVFLEGSASQVGDGGEGVFLDDVVGGFAADPGFDGGHHDSGGEEEGEVVGGLFGDDGGVGFHLVEDGEEGFEQAVAGKEGVGKHHAADHGAGDVALVPLVAGEGGGHGEVAFQDGVEAVDALAGTGVHLVGHGGGTGLSWREAFGGGFVTGHEAEGLGEGGRAAAEFDKRGDDGEVEGAGVDLAYVFPDVGNAEVGGEALLELGHLRGVAIEEGELVELGADSALESAHAVAGDQMLEATEGVDEFFSEHGEALAVSGRFGPRRCGYAR